jgi:hypothetical protein
MLAHQSTAGRTVFVPAFTQVKAVSHIKAEKATTTEDLFEVRFEIEPLSKPILSLMEARKVSDTTARALAAIMAGQQARTSLTTKYDQIVEGVEDPARRERLARMGQGTATPHNYSRYGSADEWFDDANWIVQELSK